MLRYVKNGMLLLSVAYIVIGMLLLIMPETSLLWICNIFGVVVLVTGIVCLIQYARIRGTGFTAPFMLVGGVITAGLGIFTLAKPQVVTSFLPVVFGIFIVVVIVSLFLVIPDRDAALDITWLTATAMILLGIVTGILAGLLGVGGGVIIVPALMLLFGASDLVAKGTSLLVMIPTSLTGTLSNYRAKNVDLSAALAVGLPACVTTFVGSMVATAVSPMAANIAFAVFLAFVAVQMFWKALRRGGAGASGGAGRG